MTHRTDTKPAPINFSSDEPTVSVVMPLLNEERYLPDVLESLLKQTYPRPKMEWIFVDGGSEDRTKKILESYRARYPELIFVLDNPQKTVPYAMNLGIDSARSELLIRLDAHACYPEDYIANCVRVFLTAHREDPRIMNVGGVIETRAKTRTGSLIADVLSSPFGVGNAKFRTEPSHSEDPDSTTQKPSGSVVDTVPFGCFPRELFSEIGGFDTRFSRNEDNELNARIRSHGYKVYLSPEIVSTYYCRDTVWSLMQQAYSNGYWNIVSMRLVPNSMGLRHLIPFLFLLSVIVLPLLGLWRPVFYWLLGAELLLYFSLALWAATKGSQQKPGQVFLKLWLFPIFHLSYGWGSLVSLIFPKEFHHAE